MPTLGVSNDDTDSSVCRALPTRGVSMDDDGDINPGTTTVEILNKEQDQGIFFEAYSPVGFLLSSGIRVMGPCAVFPKSVLHWNVSSRNVCNRQTWGQIH